MALAAKDSVLDALAATALGANHGAHKDAVLELVLLRYTHMSKRDRGRAMNEELAKQLSDHLEAFGGTPARWGGAGEGARAAANPT